MVDKFAVIGDPIEHSKSLNLHRAAHPFLGVDWSYERIRVPADTLQDFVETLGPEWRGLSVTMPLKLEALELSETTDEASVLAQGANTLLLSNESRGRVIHGYNTDILGLRNALKHTDWEFSNRAWILGGGATARSALIAMSGLGIEEVNVLVRSVERAQDLARIAAHLTIKLNFFTPELLKSDTSLRLDTLVVNTLPSSADLQAMGLNQARFTDTTRLYEVVYDNWPSPLAESVTAQEGAVASGITMLVEQALLQLRIFMFADVTRPLPRELEVLAAMRASVDLG